MNTKYLFVDLDGTFARNDLFQELLIKKVSTNPIDVLYTLLKSGILGLKHLVFADYVFSVQQIVVNEEVFNLLSFKKEIGYKIILITASPQIYADYVRMNWNIFENAIGSDKSINLKGKEKLKVILSIAGGNLFEYIGDSEADKIIFNHCRKFYKITNNKLYEFIS